MQRLIDFLSLCRVNCHLGVAAFGMVLAARLCLSILPFRMLQLLSRHSDLKGSVGSPETIARRSRIAAAVRAASRLVPGATCLTQALAAQALLRLRGDRPTLCLGVTRATDGAFGAHAWLEAEGEVIIGELSDMQRYQRLLPSAGK